jgi:hypothetical protein
MSARTGGTASNRKRRSKGSGRFGVVVTRVHRMNTDEFRQSLIAAGIIDGGGKLEEKYKGSKNPKTAD